MVDSSRPRFALAGAAVAALLVALLAVAPGPLRAQTTSAAPAVPGATDSAAPAPRPAASRLASIIASGVLRVGTTGDYKPFTYRNPSTGEYEGMDIDAARMLGAALGVRVVFVQTSWPKLSADLLADKFDIAMGGITRTLGREKIASLSEPYMQDGKVMLIRASDEDRFRTLADADRPNVRIIVNPGGTNEAFDKAHLHNAQLIVVSDNLAIPAMLAGGKADVFITDGTEAILNAHRDPRLHAVDPTHPLTPDTKGYLLHQGDTALLGFVNLWMEQMKASGGYARLRAQWIGD